MCWRAVPGAPPQKSSPNVLKEPRKFSTCDRDRSTQARTLSRSAVTTCHEVHPEKSVSWQSCVATSKNRKRVLQDCHERGVRLRSGRGRIVFSSPQDGGSGESCEPALQALALFVPTCYSASSTNVLPLARGTVAVVLVEQGFETNTVTSFLEGR